MMDGRTSCRITSERVPVMESVLQYADEFYLTAAAQKNRNYLAEYVHFADVPFAMEEVLFDPQTSGGLLLAVHPDDVQDMAAEMNRAGLPAAVIGEITEKTDYEINVR